MKPECKTHFDGVQERLLDGDWAKAQELLNTLSCTVGGECRHAQSCTTRESVLRSVQLMVKVSGPEVAAKHLPAA